LLSVTAHLLHHNRSLFLRTRCWKDTWLVEHSANVSHTAVSCLQNRCQKVVIRGALRSCRGDWHSNLTKLPIIYSVSYLKWGGLDLCLGGSATKALPWWRDWMFIYTYIYKIGAASVERCLSRWQCYKNTCEITAEKNDWVAIALMILHHNVKVNYSKSIYCSTFYAANKMVICSILKGLFSKYNAWLIFCSDNATTISEASSHSFQYEKFLVKI